MSLWYMKRRLEAESQNRVVANVTTLSDLPKVDAKEEIADETVSVVVEPKKKGRPSKK